MGYGYVPDVTDEKVVCQKLCVHTDCALTIKEWRNALCSLCGCPLLKGEAFYYEADGAAHAHCVWDKAEAKT